MKKSSQPELFSARVTAASYRQMELSARNRVTKCDGCLKITYWNRVQAYRSADERDYNRLPLQLCDQCFHKRNNCLFSSDSSVLNGKWS